MAKLTTKARKALPKSSFAGPDRSYPIEDAVHARDALSRVSANGSPELKAHVRAEVHDKYPKIEQSHKFPAHKGESHGYGHAMNNRKGSLRMSGHSSAHRIGSK